MLCRYVCVKPGRGVGIGEQERATELADVRATREAVGEGHAARDADRGRVREEPLRDLHRGVVPVSTHDLVGRWRSASGAAGPPSAKTVAPVRLVRYSDVNVGMTVVVRQQDRPSPCRLRGCGTGGQGVREVHAAREEEVRGVVQAGLRDEDGRLEPVGAGELPRHLVPERAAAAGPSSQGSLTCRRARRWSCRVSAHAGSRPPSEDRASSAPATRLASRSGPTLVTARGAPARASGKRSPRASTTAFADPFAGNEFCEILTAVSTRSTPASTSLARPADLRQHDVVAGAADVADPVGRCRLPRRRSRPRRGWGTFLGSRRRRCCR